MIVSISTDTGISFTVGDFIEGSDDEQILSISVQDRSDDLLPHVIDLKTTNDQDKLRAKHYGSLTILEVLKE